MEIPKDTHIVYNGEIEDQDAGNIIIIQFFLNYLKDKISFNDVLMIKMFSRQASPMKKNYL